MSRWKLHNEQELKRDEWGEKERGRGERRGEIEIKNDTVMSDIKHSYLILNTHT